MVYPAHIQWNGFISGHVDGPQAAMVPSRPSHPAPDDRSAVPPVPTPAAACSAGRSRPRNLRKTSTMRGWA